MGNLTHTVSGDIASFRSAARVPIESLKCHFLPIQEGTGDPSPTNIRPISGWNSINTYCTSKNLFNYNVPFQNPDNILLSNTNKRKFQPYTYSLGLADTNYYGATKLSDVSISNEMFTYNTTSCGYGIGFAIPVKSGETYRLSYISENAQVWMVYFKKDGTYISKANVVNSLIVPSDAVIGVILFTAGANDTKKIITVSNVQLELNSIKTVHESYRGQTIPITFPILGKNKLPLTSATTITSVGTGYNNTLSRTLTPGTIYQNVSANNYWLGQSNNNYTNNVGNGEITYMCNDGAYGQGLCIEVLPSTQYIASIAENEKAEIRWSYFDAEGNCIGYNTAKKNKVITTPVKTRYALIIFTISSSDYKNQLITVTNAQVEFGSTATTYEPYSSNNTVYGGYIDIINGKLIKEYEKVIIDENSTLTLAWNSIQETTTRFVYQIPQAYTHDLTKSCYVDKAKYGAVFGDYVTWYRQGLREFNIYIPNTLTGITSEDDEATLITKFKAWLAENPISYVFALQTPIEYQLTPIQLKAFLNQNNIWSNTNDITEVSYQIHDSNMIRSTRKQIIGNEPHIETISDTIATFNTDIAAPLKECKIYFNPIQEGSGDPSPENVRELTGYTQLKLYTVGKGIRSFQTDQYEITNDYHVGNNGWSGAINNSPALWGRTITYSAYINAANATGPGAVGIIKTKSDGSTFDARLAGNIIEKGSNGWSYITIEIPGNGVRLYPEMNAYKGCIFTKPMVELGNTRTEYEPYNYTSFPLDWTSIAGTLYGGYVDLIKGELIVEQQKLTLSNTTKIGVSNTYKGSFWLNTTEFSYIDTTKPILCNRLKYINNKLDFSYGTCINYNQSSINLWVINSETTVTENTIHNWLEDNTTEIIFYLKNPIRYQLSPIQLKALKGTNNIWSNANGPVSITYWTH